MKANEAIREVMKMMNIGTNKMADRIGAKAPRLVSDRLNQENMSIKTMNEMLRVMDYKIVIMPTDVRTPNGGIEIE